MSRHVVIGTAGHVDHGKTVLVKALTGTDTDRFPEEKRRGITIDIGFAALELAGGLTASVVDVPGHEDFIRNMVAGATGVDVALLVVAADEGVMPQTIEHLAILELLGIQAGVIAVTKAELVDPEWLELVEADVAERVRGTAITWEPPVAVSAVTGSGLDGLRAALARSATRAAGRAADDLFRMPVDRIFSLAGAGTVVTGTTWSGAVGVGEQVTVLPEGLTARVRSVEVHGERLDRAEPGRRTALALAGLPRAAASRGSVAVTDPSWRATSVVDVVLTLLPGAPRPITQRSRLRFHLGTAEVMTRVTPAGDAVAPGTSGIARLRLEQPVVPRWGDRAVIRSYSPIATIGGAMIIDPWPPARPRRPAGETKRAEADLVTRIQGFVEEAGPHGIAVADLVVRAGVPRSHLESLVRSVTESRRARQVGGALLAAALLDQLEEVALRALRRFHASHPLAPGMPREGLRGAVGTSPAIPWVIEQLAARGANALEGGLARLPEHQPGSDPLHQDLQLAILAILAAGDSQGHTAVDLAAVAPADQARDLLELLVRQGTAVRVGPARYYHRDVLDGLVRRALREIDRSGHGTPAQLRDSLGLTRKYLIPILEWMDQRGLTVRAGDARRLTPAGHQYKHDTQ